MIELSGHEWHAEMQRRANDIIRVHNPTMEEYIVKYDTSNTNTLWQIPPANKDQFGAGRGNRDVPRYIAERFMEQMVDIKMNEDHAKVWEKKKKDYGTRDNIYLEEERHMRNFRTVKREDEVRKKVWLGVVKRHGDTISVEEPKIARKSDGIEGIMERLDLDRPIEQNLQDLSKEVESAS